MPWKIPTTQSILKMDNNFETKLCEEIRKIFAGRSNALSNNEIVARISRVDNAMALKSCKNCQDLTTAHLSSDILQILSTSSTNQHKKYKFMGT